MIHMMTDGFSDDAVTLIVQNDSKAITDKMLLHLFKSMRRTSAELVNANRRVGLGLYIVKHIVEAHEGQVSVTSSDATGTVVRVELPRRVG